jgi:hypothetical protein
VGEGESTPAAPVGASLAEVDPASPPPSGTDRWLSEHDPGAARERPGELHPAVLALSVWIVYEFTRSAAVRRRLRASSTVPAAISAAPNPASISMPEPVLGSCAGRDVLAEGAAG